MHRFYIAREIDGDTVSISDEEQLHHIRDVLRLKANDEIIIFDSRGDECTCLITRIDKGQTVLTVQSKKRAGDKRVKITVACAMPKAGMGEIIDNLTQLGVDGIIPMETERVIVRLDDSRKEARLKRWRKIARSASQQSQRNTVPLIWPVTSIEGVIEQSQDFDLKLVPTLSGDRKHINELFTRPGPGNILVLIGPEGDFTPEEIGLAKSAGFIPVSLGDSVLRVGTAAIAVVSYIRLALNA